MILRRTYDREAGKRGDGFHRPEIPGLPWLLSAVLIVILIFAVLLVTATNVGAVVVSLLILALAGTLFWFLIKAMARIQMPDRPT